MKTRLITVSRYTAIVVLTTVILLLFARNNILGVLMKKEMVRFNERHHASLDIKGIRMSGLASVMLTGISLKPAGADTLMVIDTAYASFSLLNLIAGRITIHDARFEKTRITIISHDSVNNYTFGRDESRDEKAVSPSADYAVMADRLLGLAFDRIPRTLHLHHFYLEVNRNGSRTSCYIDELNIRDHFFHSRLIISGGTGTQQWDLAGRLDNGKRIAEFRISSPGTSKLMAPFLKDQWNADVRFDTLAFSFTGSGLESDLTRLSGYLSVSGLVVDHPRISARTVRFDRLAFHYALNIGHSEIGIDSSSMVTFNRLTLHPYILYKPGPPKQLTVRVNKPWFAATDLFSSIPEGLFTCLQGVRVKGDLSWNLFLSVDLSCPDSLRFETSLDRNGFGVISYGSSDLMKINDTFTYTAYEKEIPVRKIFIGPSNPDFRKLDQISRYLKAAVLTSEDGGFYQHRGFLPDAFRESMVTNIKERRFARGGSTISMQLVKNVFLSRNKTIARKLEEALIVWLIENQGLSTKDRMLEVYLNIIEWGPMIYGANEAGHFYFGKDASRLTLSEAIFMSSVIPRPKWFRYSFAPDGHLAGTNAAYYSLCLGKMTGKGWITQKEAEEALPDVELKGPARFMLKRNDTVMPDTVSDPLQYNKW